MLLCSRKALRKYVNVAREQQHRDAGLEQTVETAAALLARQTLYITGLNLAHDLDTVRIKIIKKSCQLQTGTVYVVLGDLGLFKALRTVNDLKIKFMDQIAQADTEFF